ncbi:MAG TPA: ABC transporter substrate-binding protein, partial [Tepidisphaeraceae bacterium]|nr:ABC transporter substrate-binding protein [Tepidisphaeraceae bacterium]
MIWRFVRVLALFGIVGGAGALLVYESRNRAGNSAGSMLTMVSQIYTPGVVRPDGSRPLHELADVAGKWEGLVNQRWRKKQKGYSEPWQLRFLTVPALGPSAESWTLTRLLSRTAPEFMSAQLTPDFQQHAKDWYVDMTPYLDQPNPYVAGNAHWRDLFYPAALAQWRNPYDGRLYCVPLDEVEVTVFYNLRLLKRCGIPASAIPPADWQQFIELQKRIKAAGVIPFLMPAAEPVHVRWAYQILTDMSYDELYQKVRSAGPPTEGDAISYPEMIRAFKDGILSPNDPRYLESWRIIKEWSRYWQPGYLGSNDPNAFARGNAAMTLEGSWYVATLENDSDRDFDYAVYPLPRLTQATSRFADGAPARGVGGAAAVQLAITRESVEHKGAVRACVDFLMFLTTPKNLGPVVAEADSFLPAVQGAATSPKLRFMLPALKIGNVRFP